MQITIKGTAIVLDPSPAETAALGERRVLANAPIIEANDWLGPDDEPAPLYASDAAYLEWAVTQWAQSNPGASADDIRATAERALRSWAGTPPPNPPAPEELSPEAQRARLIAYAANKRWQKEVGGTTINNIKIPTDDRAKLLLLGAAQSMKDDSSAPLVINGTNYGLLTKAQFQGINSALIAHVQNTFAVLAEILEDINSEIITDTSKIDERF